MNAKDKWKAWHGAAAEFCLDLIGPIRRWKDKKRRDKLEADRLKRNEYAKWAKYQNAMAEKAEEDSS